MPLYFSEEYIEPDIISLKQKFEEYHVTMTPEQAIQSAIYEQLISVFVMPNGEIKVTDEHHSMTLQNVWYDVTGNQNYPDTDKLAAIVVPGALRVTLINAQTGLLVLIAMHNTLTEQQKNTIKQLSRLAHRTSVDYKKNFSIFSTYEQFEQWMQTTENEEKNLTGDIKELNRNINRFRNTDNDEQTVAKRDRPATFYKEIGGNTKNRAIFARNLTKYSSSNQILDNLEGIRNEYNKITKTYDPEQFLKILKDEPVSAFLRTDGMVDVLPEWHAYALEEICMPYINGDIDEYDRELTQLGGLMNAYEAIIPQFVRLSATKSYAMHMSGTGKFTPQQQQTMRIWLKTKTIIFDVYSPLSVHGFKNPNQFNMWLQNQNPTERIEKINEFRDQTEEQELRKIKPTGFYKEIGAKQYMKKIADNQMLINKYQQNIDSAFFRITKEIQWGQIKSYIKKQPGIFFITQEGTIYQSKVTQPEHLAMVFKMAFNKDADKINKIPFPQFLQSVFPKDAIVYTEPNNNQIKIHVTLHSIPTPAQQQTISNIINYTNNSDTTVAIGKDSVNAQYGMEFSQWIKQQMEQQYQKDIKQKPSNNQNNTSKQNITDNIWKKSGAPLKKETPEY